MTRVLLCDADGCLFPSEEPAFVASAGVTNRLLAQVGVERSYDADELRAFAVGKNFRATALELAARHGATIDEEALERGVEDERREVTEHLARVLEPDPAVQEPLARMAERFTLTVVSSSAIARLAACFTATGLDDLFPHERRFSAEDSLPVPTSKPDPAIYTFAGEALGVGPDEAVAVEDSVTGTRSAVAAGFPTIGNVQFVPPDELDERVEALRAAGVAEIVGSWGELETLLARGAAL